MPDDQIQFYALLRTDLVSFITKCYQTVDGSQPYLHNWHIDVLADYLELVRTQGLTRLIVNLPPRYLKSHCVSVAYVAWLLGHDPSLRIICASYDEGLAKKFARECRTIMQTSWYRHTFPKTRISRKKSAEGDFETTKGGGRYSTSVGGAITGRGGRVIIVDDLMKPQDAHSEAHRRRVNTWFDGTLHTRLDDKKNGAIILVMQRLHVDDPIAHALQSGGWQHLSLPATAETHEVFQIADGLIFERFIGEALHPEREPIEVLEGIRKTIGNYAFQAQYQQAPMPCPNRAT